MYLKPAICSMVTCLLLTSLVPAESLSTNFTLQVASFADQVSAQEFAAILARQGLSTAIGTVTLPNRGNWTRVFVGKFKTASEAQKYGQKLLLRELIKEFVVTRVNEDELQAKQEGKARNVTAAYGGVLIVAPGLLSKRVNTGTAAADAAMAKLSKQGTASIREPGQSGILNAQRPAYVQGDRARLASFLDEGAPTNSAAKTHSAGGFALPTSLRRDPGVSLAVNAAQMPRPNPIQLAFNVIAGARSVEALTRTGGLWLSGDIAEGLARLRWIAGTENADVLSVDKEGRVRLDAILLAHLARLDKAGPAAAPIVAADYIISNEGLTLLVQLTQGASRYRLHLGDVAPTAAGETAKVQGSINLDNNFDSRINPYRRTGKKFPNERPPDGFEALIAINPQAQWYNITAASRIPAGHITFHELAEAYAKVEFGLDYLPQPLGAGAHNIAIEREKVLKRQRPSANIVVTLGSNRLLKSLEEARAFYASAGGSIGGQR